MRASAAAWGAVGIVAGSVALAAWWLSVDHGVPSNDAAQHLYFAFIFHDGIAEGQFGAVLDFPSYYPPLTYLFGAAATFIGGVNVVTPILALDLVYIPLLALACYRIARMLGGPRAGLVAVGFALAAPLVIEQMHVFMLELPQAALVAVTAWLLLASERFARTRTAAGAGLVMGLAIATKELAPLYLIGVVACLLARGGGWRNWRGIVSFVALALLIGAPWYVRQSMLGELGKMLHAAEGGGDVPAAARPRLLSFANATWYLWATLNGLLFAPLFALATAGVCGAVMRVWRARPLDDFTLELLCGLGGAWLALSALPHHDMRYALGFLLFFAVLTGAWMARLPRIPQAALAAALIAVTAAAHLGATFGVGGSTDRRLPGNRMATYGEGVPPRGRVVVYSNHNYLVSGPVRRPDVLTLFKALRAEGVTLVEWEDQIERWDPQFESLGLVVFARVAHLQYIPPGHATPGIEEGEASLIRAWTFQAAVPPCMTLGDGSKVWVRIRGFQELLPQIRCPARI